MDLNDNTILAAGMDILTAVLSALIAVVMREKQKLLAQIRDGETKAFRQAFSPRHNSSAVPNAQGRSRLDWSRQWVTVYFAGAEGLKRLCRDLGGMC
ncbi:MAG: hypothetical protein ABSA13_14325 [Beijerinckiaceae bacterium]|jgi:hypothetical protein